MFSRILFITWMLISNTAQAAIDIQYWQTTNGAKVYFVEAPELAMVDINVIFDAGAARDKNQSGLARLTNAMLDQGAAGLDTDKLATAFADVGARFGYSAERDMASVSLRSLTTESSLKPALETFTKVLTQPDFPESSFKRLRNQVLIGLQAEKQSPAALATRALYKNLFGEHAYSTMPVGTEQAVTALSLEDIKTFYQQYYVAANAVIVMVGALDKVQAEQITEQIVTGLQTGEKVAELDPVKPLTQAHKVMIEHPSTQTHIYMGQPGISRTDPDYFALYVGNHILGGSGLVSMLSNEIREKRGLSYSSYSYFRPMRQLGPYQLGLQTKNEQAQQALEVMQVTLSGFTKNGPTEAQLTAAKKNITGGFALRIDSNSKLIGYLAMIGFYELPLDYLSTFKDKVNAITVTQIKEAYSRRVNPKNMVTVMVGGKAE